MPGTLLLIPNLLDEKSNPEDVLPQAVFHAVASLDGVIAEDAKRARAFLKRFPKRKPFSELPIEILNEHTPEGELGALLAPLAAGGTWGLISDAGVPVIADPGYALVRLAHERGITVQPLVGPCSLVLALMMSGLPAQRFRFCGYLPRKPEERKREIALMEEDARKHGTTQLCIEAPYRNDALLQDLVATLRPETTLAVVWGITSPEQGLRVQQVKQWRKEPLPTLKQVPAVFLFSVTFR